MSNGVVLPATRVTPVRMPETALSRERKERQPNRQTAADQDKRKLVLTLMP